MPFLSSAESALNLTITRADTPALEGAIGAVWASGARSDSGARSTAQTRLRVRVDLRIETSPASHVG